MLSLILSCATIRVFQSYTAAGGDCHEKLRNHKRDDSAEENHMIRTNEIVTLYHGSKSGIRGILDEQKLTEDDRKKLKQESEANRSKGIAMADEICRKYRRDGMFFDEILKAGE